MQKINWKEGVPTKLGMYFVAVELGSAAGVYDFAEWNGDSWEANVKGDVVAYIDIGSFICELSIEWPFEDKVDYQPKRKSDDEEPWSEV